MEVIFVPVCWLIAQIAASGITWISLSLTLAFKSPRHFLCPPWATLAPGTTPLWKEHPFSWAHILCFSIFCKVLSFFFLPVCTNFYVIVFFTLDQVLLLVFYSFLFFGVCVSASGSSSFHCAPFSVPTPRCLGVNDGHWRMCVPFVLDRSYLWCLYLLIYLFLRGDSSFLEEPLD